MSLQDKLNRVVESAPEGVRVAVWAQHLESGEVADVAGDAVFNAASTIKIAIMATVARAVDSGKLSLDTRVPVRPEAVVPGSGVVRFMEPNLELSINDHTYLMISISDNTTSNILIDQVSLEAVQQVCTEFATEGLMLGRKFFGTGAHGQPAENHVTARGLSTLLKNIWNGNVASETMTEWMKDLLGKQQYRERLARSLQWDTEPWYGGKTGSLETVTHDCGIFHGPGGTIVCAVLSDNCPDIYTVSPWMGEVGKVFAERVR